MGVGILSGGYETNGEGEADAGWAVEEHTEPGRTYWTTNRPFGNAGRRKVVVCVITLANARGVPLHGRILE